MYSKQILSRPRPHATFSSSSSRTLSPAQASLRGPTRSEKRMFKRFFLATHRLPRHDRMIASKSTPRPSPLLRTLQNGIEYYDSISDSPISAEKPIYCIMSKSDKTHQKNPTYFTCPFEKPQERVNVFITFTCPVMAHTVCEALSAAREHTFETKEMSFHDLSYHALCILRIPYIVIMRAFCDMEEKETWYTLFYAQRDAVNVSEIIANTSDIDAQNIIDLLNLIEEHKDVLEEVFFYIGEDDEEDEDEDDDDGGSFVMI